MPMRLVRLLAALILVLLSACDGVGAAPAAPATPSAIPTNTPLPPPPTDTAVPPTTTPAPTAVSLDVVQTALQAVVDNERKAIIAGDKDTFLAQIDPGDRAWYHYQEDQFNGDSLYTSVLNCVSNVPLV
jgi:hypothetical protein